MNILSCSRLFEFFLNDSIKTDENFLTLFCLLFSAGNCINELEKEICLLSVLKLVVLFFSNQKSKNTKITQ